MPLLKFIRPLKAGPVLFLLSITLLGEPGVREVPHNPIELQAHRVQLTADLGEIKFCRVNRVEKIGVIILQCLDVLVYKWFIHLFQLLFRIIGANCHRNGTIFPHSLLWFDRGRPRLLLLHSHRGLLLHHFIFLLLLELVPEPLGERETEG